MCGDERGCLELVVGVKISVERQRRVASSLGVITQFRMYARPNRANGGKRVLTS
jgi:hypothetical protein